MPRIALEELESRLAGLFRAGGLAAEEAALLAEVLSYAEGSGRRTHGLIRVQTLLRQLAARGHRPGRWLREGPGYALYDGGDGLGYLVAYECARKAAALARQHPLAVVGARGATHTGPIGFFARHCARQGLIALCLANCYPLAAPFGALTAVLGTNPIAVALPREGTEPLLIDLGTTATTFGECRLAIAEGRRLPEGVALDREGQPTTDPAAALESGALLPFGGHKGYALALAVQALTSAFTGASALPPPQGDYGFTIAAVRPDLLVERELYDRQLEKLLAAVKASRPAEPGGEVRLPGERAAAAREQARQEGIEVPEALWREVFGAESLARG